VEILVMLPFFIALFFATFYLHDLAMAAQRAGVASRSCIWAHAVSGCPKDRPAVCDDLDLSDGEAIPNKDDSKRAEPSESAFDRISDIPVVGPMVAALFGTGVHITATRSARGFMTSEHVTMSRTNYVVCNTVPATWGEKLEELKNAVRNWGK
jgi:hypothetical protein